jgi:hypothetical protein
VDPKDAHVRAPKVTINHELHPHIVEAIAFHAPLEMRATSRHWRDYVGSFTRHWRLEQWQEPGWPGTRLDANIHTSIHQRRPWEPERPQKQYPVHPLFERFAQYPLPTRLVPLPEIDYKITGLVRALDAIASTAYEEHWQWYHFRCLEVIRFFSCNMGAIAWPTFFGAPIAVLYGEVRDPGLKFRLTPGVKHLIMNLGEPTALPKQRIGVSHPPYFAPACLLPHMVNPTLIPDTVERMTVILRDLDTWKTPLNQLVGLWVRWFRWQALRLSRGVQFDIVGDLRCLPTADRSPYRIRQAAADTLLKYPEFLRLSADPNVPSNQLQPWIGQSWRLPLEGDQNAATVAKSILQSLPDPAQLKPIKERVRIMSNDEFRADVGERIYAFAMDPLYVEV